MIGLCTVSFWISLVALFYSYIVYPAIMQLIASRRLTQPAGSSKEPEYPTVSVLIPAHNEGAVIEQKVLSVLNSNYFTGKLEIIVGSDASTDDTDSIIGRMTQEWSNLKLIALTERSGKAAVVNTLAAEATGEILVVTDADAILEPDTIVQLTKPFTDPLVGLVDSRIVYKASRSATELEPSEETYISIDGNIKRNESVAFGKMMGPFGACFAVRAGLFSPIPQNFLVDDFYLNMLILEQGGLALVNPEAVVRQEQIPDGREEFRRRVRIGAGNYQNLLRFFPLLLRFNATSFSFFSHKFVRWLGPLLLLVAYLCSYVLMTKNVWLAGFYLMYFAIQTAMLFSPLIHQWLLSARVRCRPVSMISHFIAANCALALGFLWFISGIRSGVWQPTKRIP
jgi:cellulose synthase/poly-beta-1,6-N-acetylglucosamine synthase-like glycosyltransferase